MNRKIIKKHNIFNDCNGFQYHVSVALDTFMKKEQFNGKSLVLLFLKRNERNFILAFIHLQYETNHSEINFLGNKN